MLSSVVVVRSHGLLVVRFLGHLPDRLVVLACDSTTWLMEIKLALERGCDGDGVRLARVYWDLRAGVVLVLLCELVIGLIASSSPPWARVLQNLQIWLLNLTFPQVQVHSDLLYQQHMLCSLLLKMYCRFSHLIENILLLLIHRGRARLLICRSYAQGVEPLSVNLIESFQRIWVGFIDAVLQVICALHLNFLASHGLPRIEPEVVHLFQAIHLLGIYS